jgi:hypothetical protein
MIIGKIDAVMLDGNGNIDEMLPLRGTADNVPDVVIVKRGTPALVTIYRRLTAPGQPIPRYQEATSQTVDVVAPGKGAMG